MPFGQDRVPVRETPAWLSPPVRASFLERLSMGAHGIDRSPPSRAHPRLGETGLPVLLLGATEPPKDGARRDTWRERFAKQVPQADVRRVEGAPHLMLEARPGKTAREIGEWLRALPYP